MKGSWKRVMSGVLSVLTIATTVFQPITTYAAEPDNTASSFESQYPELETVKDKLAEDEIVTASDYTVEYGSDFDIKVDFSGIEGINDAKVKIELYEAKSEAGEDFDTGRADTYKAVYKVEPVSGNPSYRVSRNVTVREAETEAVTMSNTSENTTGEGNAGETEDIGTADDEETDRQTETEVVTDLTEESETTTDEETGLTVSDVMEQADEEGIDLYSLDEGESVTFMARVASTTSTKKVTVTRGACYQYSDYGYGSYLTYQYTVKFGSVSATAYCIQPEKSSPGSGTYDITKLSDGKKLAKVCYYGTKASGDDGFFTEENGYGNLSTGARFILVHLAASYANSGDSAFSGASSKAKTLAMKLYNYCISQPNIPDVEMSFSDANVTAYVDGSSQRTKEITFKADELQSITMKLPSGVKLHNVTTGKTSKAGESVVISGGTKFYLSAPLTQVSDVAGSWSATMKGSITKDYSAYKISTGSGSQDLALVFGEGVDDEKYVDFKVTWVQYASVKVIKKDSKANAKLSGAVFGLYSDADCKNLITKLPATDANGEASAQIVKTQDTVYLKEITAPSGYRINATAYNVKLEVSKTTTVTVPDEEQLGQLTVYKEGEVLTGADVTENGTTFRYEKRRQKGAVYNVYAGADITTAYGTKVYSKGDLVKENLTTDSNGAVILKNLHLGTYVVKEVQAPSGFYNAGEEKTVKLAYAGQNVEVVFSETTFTNDRQKAEVIVTKQDKDTENPLNGGVFGIYAASDITNVDGTVVVKKGTLIEKATTGTDGKAKFSADLPLGFSYEVKEEQAPTGYVRNTEDVYQFAFSYTNDKEAKVTFNHTFKNERVTAKISLQKLDAETKKAVPQGDATLEKAVYGLYARENIVHPDGATGVMYKAGDQVATLTTDENGQASVSGLYLGSYYVKEITPPTGYLADENEYDLSCDYEGDMTAEVKRECTSLEQVMKQPFQIIKAANNGKTDADLLQGVGFSAWLVSDLKVKADGSYDFDSARPVVLTADGQTEMFTDEKGYARSIPLPYGTYVVRETTSKHNYAPVDDFVVKITENHPDTPQTWRVLLDKEFKAKLKIIKKDAETQKSVLLANTEFKVYDLDNQKYVEQTTSYPKPTVHKSYFTNEEGYLVLPKNLKPGNYRIEEVTAPDGYTISKNYVTVAVDTDTAYLTDPVTGDAVIDVEYTNAPVKGQLKIYKQGEVLKGFDKDFQYEMAGLAGAEFEVYAAEDIYTADHQVDADGQRTLYFAKDALVATVTTDADGYATVKNLPLGRYYVKEKNAPDTYVLNTVPENVEFAYADQDTAVIEKEISVTDERQKVSITVEKQDAETGNTVAGAVFGIYNAKDIQTKDGKVIVKADTLLQEMTSDEKGQAACTLDLPLGSYYVKELKAPDGFVSSDEVLRFDASYQGQDVQTVTLKSVKKNQPTTVEITKSDATTGVELDGAYLKVTDKDGNVVDSWTSSKDAPHVIKYLKVGETYTLHEEFAPHGYLVANDVTFTVKDTGEVQKVEMKDEVPVGELIINKKGEFLDSVTLADKVKGVVEHIFNYVTGKLTDVTFEVYAEEDIKAADGVSDDYYKKDELIATIKTDETGIAKLENLPLGKYYVKETGTAYGHVLDGEIRHVDLTYVDQNTPVVVYDKDWQNNRQRVEVSVLKKEKDSDRTLEGAIFGLFAKEDIKSETTGKVLIEADEIIELKSTDEEGKITFVADLPIGATYYVKELYAPDGFVTNDEVKEFTFEYAGEDQPTVTYDFTFDNQPTVVEFTKSSLTTGKELPGCKLKVVDADGNIVDEWTSGKEAHVIRELTVGKEYTLVETKPADGYVTAESVKFTIKDTADVQKVEMKDDVTKVKISKQDIAGKELPGAKLTILDQDGKVVESWTSTEKAHYIEMLPIGKYTLREETAPDGYLVAKDVEFEVKDTCEVQHVTMVDEKKPAEKTPEGGKPVSDSPKTGDNTNLWLWFMLLGIGATGTGALAFMRKKKH